MKSKISLGVITLVSSLLFSCGGGALDSKVIYPQERDTNKYQETVGKRIEGGIRKIEAEAYKDKNSSFVISPFSTFDAISLMALMSLETDAINKSLGASSLADLKKDLISYRADKNYEESSKSSINKSHLGSMLNLNSNYSYNIDAAKSLKDDLHISFLKTKVGEENLKAEEWLTDLLFGASKLGKIGTMEPTTKLKLYSGLAYESSFVEPWSESTLLFNDVNVKSCRELFDMNVYSSDDFEAISLSLGSETLEFYLPKGTKTINSVSSSVSFVSGLSSLPQKKYHLSLNIPSFSLSNELDLNPLLIQGGFESLLTSEDLFQKVIKEEKVVDAIEISQKASFDFGCQGISASALTSIKVPTTSNNPENLPTKALDFNKDFIFRLVDRWRLPLFVGTVSLSSLTKVSR